MQNSPDLLENDLKITPAIQENLIASAKWGRFIAVVGFILTALTLLVALTSTLFYDNHISYNQGVEAVMAIVFFIILSVLAFVTALFLFRFANKMLDAANKCDQGSFDGAVQNLKSLFRLIGILTIIGIGLAMVVFLIVVLVAINQ